LQLIGAIVSSMASVVAWRRRKEPGGAPLALLMLAVTEWGVSAALKNSIPLYSTRIFWATAEILGASSAAVLYLLFVLEYIQQDKLLVRRNVLLLWIIPILSLGLAGSNPWHALFWTFSLPQGEAGPLISNPGPLFWIYLGFYYLLRVIGSLALLWTIVRLPATYRSQMWTLIAGALLPWLSNLVSFFITFDLRFSVIAQDLHPLAYALSGLVLGWGIFRYRLFDLVPLARDIVIDNLRDGIIVLDAIGRIVDINSAAEQLLGIKSEQSLGNPAHLILADYPALIEMIEQGEAGGRDIRIPPPRVRYLEAHLILVVDKYQRQRGRMLTLRDVTEQKRFQEALIQSEANLSLLLESAPFPMTITSLDGKIIYANPAALELYELGPENLLSIKPISLFDSPAQLKELINWKLQNTGKIDRMELKLHTVTGKERWVVASIRKFMFNGEETLLSAQFDINERKRMEDELRQSRAQLRVIFDYAGVGIRVLDTKGNYIFANDHWAGMLGSKPEELVGKEETLFQHPNDNYYSREKFDSLLSGEIEYYDIENRYIRADGTVFWGALTATPIYNENRQIESIVGFILDITDRKQAEMALRETERRFREILENIYLMAVMLDKDGKIIFCNDHILTLTGWQREEIMGRNWFDVFVHVEPEVRKDFGRAMRSGTIVSQHENTILTRRGEKRLASWSNILLRDAGGRITGMASIGEDITERRRAQEAELEQRTLAEALIDTSSAITTTLNFNETLDRILINVEKVVPHDAANISLIKDEELFFVRTKGYEVGDEFFEKLRLKFEQLNNVKIMAESGEPIAISDTHNSPDWTVIPETEWIRSYVGSPIIVQGKVIGFIGLNSATIGFFNSTHADRLKAFCNQCAIAIKNADLFEQSQHELEARRRAQASLRRANTKLKTQLAEIQSLQAQLQEQTILLREETIHDHLTGLYNRRYLDEMFSREISRANRGGSPLSVLMMDIDHFKKVNDVYGHPAGDQVLKNLGEILLAGTRRADIVCRYGGEEFVIILVEASTKNAVQCAEKLRKIVEDMTVFYQGDTLCITVSVGVATYPDNSQNGDELLDMADQALYAAKQAGRNRTMVFKK